jgi:hypothetical protein
MDAVVEWVDARERLPRSGYPVAACLVGLALPVDPKASSSPYCQHSSLSARRASRHRSPQVRRRPLFRLLPRGQ